MSTQEKSKALKPQVLVELVFDAGYLLFAVGAGAFMLARAGGENKALALYGLLALVLGLGDAFHLLPRIYGGARGCMDRLAKPLGFGKLVTSVTMTLFYVLLYHVWLAVYGKTWVGAPTAILYVLAAVRILLCLFPQNGWLEEGEGPLGWAILRNVPFTLMGLMIIELYYKTAVPAMDAFRNLPLAVALSFACYLPVVLWSRKKPALGALMLPKTLAYVWIISMGFSLIK